MLKVLAAAEPLSLQAHPSTAQAIVGFAAENAVRRFRGHYYTPSSCPVTLLLEHNVLGHIILLYIITNWNVFCLMLCFLL